MMRKFSSQRVVASGSAATGVRCFSEARSTYDGGVENYPWPAPGEKSVYPNARSKFPLDQPRMRKTHVEWKLYHGHGGRYGMYGPTREIADFEYEDGTPASISSRRFAYKHHQDNMLMQLIRAGAAVEAYEAEGLLPRIPGTAEQRDWDPEIPLFLEDVDEHGKAPEWGYQSLRDKITDSKFSNDGPSSNVANAHAGEELAANTMFASYDPSAFVDDHRPEASRDATRPFWSRRRWSLSNNYLVPKSPTAKNTIKDE